MIADTINEFPAFSFNLGDLHAHVLALPFTLLALGFALQVALAGPRGDVAWRAVAEALAAGLAIGTLYAINAWSYPVAAGLLVLAVAVWMRGPEAAGRRGYAAVWTLLVLIASVVVVLPFLLEFDAAARGIGRVTEHPLVHRLGGRRRADLRPARLAADGRLREPRAGRAAPAARGGLGRGGPRVRALAAGAAWTWPGSPRCSRRSAVGVHALLSRRLQAPERFLWLLVCGGVICLLIPELVYVRDEFDGSALYRQNTVFKFGYQAFLLLSMAAACALPWAAALAAAARVGAVGGGHRGARPARARLPLRRQLRAPRGLLRARRRSTGSAGCASARRATRGRSPGCAQHAAATPWCSRRSGPTTPRSGTRASPPSAAARR